MGLCLLAFLLLQMLSKIIDRREMPHLDRGLGSAERVSIFSTAFQEIHVVGPQVNHLFLSVCHSESACHPSSVYTVVVTRLSKTLLTQAELFPGKPLHTCPAEAIKKANIKPQAQLS